MMSLDLLITLVNQFGVKCIPAQPDLGIGHLGRQILQGGKKMCKEKNKIIAPLCCREGSKSSLNYAIFLHKA